ncbi:hypothetical protein [Brevibacillus laterosporus]|uniref:hypothetical protein n=1 Tax=Brevibacillus laterosporus TaxID=1465 RepID=UPI002E1BC337|nr:hypothetical protein [Brevibacillus laterosporus]MED1670427.1 hypothetical protein [Brevibacillus laterosporus]MED1720695.1 hypothetical protein [Brevibacillus laterosporus]
MFNDPLINRTGPFRPTGTPIVKITVNGKPVPHWLSFRVELNGLGSVDNYEITLPWEVTEKSPDHELLYSGPSKSSPLTTGPAIVSIEVGFEGEGSLQKLIEGDMDYPIWNFAESETVTITGRSYGARAFDFKESIKMQNMTASAAFKKIAAQHNLKPVVPVATDTFIGEYIGEDHANAKREVSHWDFILYMAQNEGFTTHVRGTEWYFGPREKLPNYMKDPVIFTWGHNIKPGLQIERAPKASRNLIIEIVSWIPGRAKKRGKGNLKGQRIVEKASFAGSSSGEKKTLRYYYPNVTRDQAQRLARKKLEELSKTQVFGSFQTDWFPDVQIDRRISLRGVGTVLSQDYFTSKLIVSGQIDSGIEAEIEFTNLEAENGGKFG